MAIEFIQIVDERFDGAKDSLLAKIQSRLRDIAAGLSTLEGVQFAHAEIRGLDWGVGQFQWRVDCYVVKPRGIKWDQVYEVINKVKAVAYDKIPDKQAQGFIQACLSESLATGMGALRKVAEPSYE